LLIARANLRPEHARRDHREVAAEVEVLEGGCVPARDDDQGIGRRGDRKPGNRVVGDDQAHHVRAGAGDLADLEPVGLRRRARVVRASKHADVEAGVAEVEGPRPTLVAVADDRDASAVED
jgi:hypothetical protein